MAKLTEREWAGVRADWETGAFSNRVLGEKWNLDESAIRHRSNRANQPGGAWVRDLDSAGKILEKATLRTLRGLSAETADIRTADEIRNDSTTRQMIREKIVDDVADELAHHQTQHMKRLESAKVLADIWAQCLETYLSPLPEGEVDSPAVVAAQAARAAAAERLLAGRTDSIAGGLQALVRMLESIQTQTRKALGVDDRIKRVEVTGANGQPIQHEHDVRVKPVDLGNLPTDKLILLYQAIQIMEGQQGRPSIPVPPTGPVIEGTAEHDNG